MDVSIVSVFRPLLTLGVFVMLLHELVAENLAVDCRVRFVGHETRRSFVERAKAMAGAALTTASD